MQNIKDILENEEFNKRRAGQKERSERASVVKEFVDVLNSDRVVSGLKPLRPAFIAYKMSHLDLWDLKIFLGSCKDAKNFSKYWWWSLKVDTLKPLSSNV